MRHISFVVVTLCATFAMLASSGCSSESAQEEGSAEAEQNIVGAPCRSSRECASTEFCDISCSSAAPVSRCATVPFGCPQIYKPVCGCNNTTYSNDCTRRAAKVGLKHAGACR